MVDVIETMRWERRIKSARALAIKAGMTHTYLNARLAGTTLFNVSDLAALANAFDCDPDDLVERALSVLTDTPDLDAEPMAALDGDEDAGAPEGDGA